MDENDLFYGQEEEGFEELVERSIRTKTEFLDDNKENEGDLLSESDDSEELEQYEDESVIKREARLQSVMNMTRNSLTALSSDERKDVKKIKSNVAMLCSALGGFDPNPPNNYFLGIEAVACLKDLKKMLKSIDEEKKVYNVASACHDSGLFVNDLIPIMVQYGMSNIKDASPERLSLLLATLELLVRLLTPITIDEEIENDTLFSKLKRAQIEYKYHLLHYKKGKIFKYIIALMIPILELDSKNVTMRDKVILNLCLTLFSNVLRIQPSDAKVAKKNRKNIVHIFEELPAGITEDDISINIVLEVFKKYEVLSVVQTVASNLSKEFDTGILGTACLDFYYYSFLYVDPDIILEEVYVKRSIVDSLSKKLNLSDSLEEKTTTLTRTNNRLLQLQTIEHDNIRKFKSKSSTRHANFGSLINVQDKKHNNRVLSGQDKLKNDNLIHLLDSNASKTESGKPLNIRKKGELDDENKTQKLNYKTTSLMGKFVEDFIKNGFGIMCKEIFDVIIPDNREITKEQFSAGDFTFQYHYLFVINWVLKFEASYQANHRRGIKTIERYKYLFFCFSKRMINTLLDKLIPLYSDSKQYPCLKISVAVLRQIMQALLTMHGYENFDDARLLNDDKLILKAIVSRSEATLRLIFEVDSKIMELFKLPQNSHQKTPSVAMEMIRFTNICLKVISYVLHLKVPIMLIRDKNHNFDEEGTFNGDEEIRMLPKNMKRYKLLDKNHCEKFRDLLFHDYTVNTHIWLFHQYEEIDTEKLKLCLSYFGKLLKDWKANIFKLIRLDFMYSLHGIKNTKNTEVSDSLLSDFGDLMSFFMHKFSKLYSNTPLILLELMSNTEITDSELKYYFLTGDPFSTADFTVRQKKEMSRLGNEDVRFFDDSISIDQKITFLVSYLFYQDDTGIIEQLIAFLNQWYHELTNTISENVQIIGKVNSYRLEGACYKKSTTNPYFRLLCRVGNIINGILIKRDEATLLKFKQIIEVTLNTPLDSYELEHKFDDPNLLYRETKRLNIKRKSGYDDSDNDGDEEDYDDGGDGYGNEGINDDDDDDDDLAGSENEGLDALELMEAKLSHSSNRVKGKAMRRTKDGNLENMSKFKNKKKKSKKDKLKSSKKLNKRRKIVKDDDEVLSDTEIKRRANLSKKYVEDSDEEMSNDEEFFERELKLQQLLQKRHGLITKKQYNQLMDGTLDLEEISDLDDNLIGENDKELGPQTAHSKPDEEFLINILKVTEDKSGDESASSENGDSDEENLESDSDNENEDTNSDSDEEESGNDEDGLDNTSDKSSDNGKNGYTLYELHEHLANKRRLNVVLSDDEYDGPSDPDGNENPETYSEKENEKMVEAQNSQKEGECENDEIREGQLEEDALAGLRHIHELMNSSNVTEELQS
jgi:hypothetical protein